MKTFSHLLSTLFFVVISLLLLLLLFAYIFRWSIAIPPSPHLLDLISGAVSLFWLLFILNVPWNLHFETRNVLFEMKRSEELGIAVNQERRAYVKRICLLTGIGAVGSHIFSAGIIAAITYWTKGEVGYYFAFFYLLATFFRPTSQAYYFLKNKLGEIKGEVKYPREDVVKLQSDLKQIEAVVKLIEEQMVADQKRSTAAEESIKAMQAEIRDLGHQIERVERSFLNRLEILSSEVERSLVKAFDQQDIVNGLRAFARLIKQS